MPSSDTLKVCGMTAAQRDRLIAANDGRCWICNETNPDATALALDHCHTFKYPRGMLCRKCNLGLPYFRDNPSLLREAAQYLDDTLLVDCCPKCLDIIYGEPIRLIKETDCGVRILYRCPQCRHSWPCFFGKTYKFGFGFV